MSLCIINRITTSDVCVHQYVISVTMIADYGNVTWRTSLARSMQVDIVNALRRGDRQQASLTLSNLEHSNQTLTKEDFSYILEYCSNAPDPLVNLLLNACLLSKHEVWYSQFD